MVKPHKLDMQESYPTGAEVWRCKNCEYSVVIQWYPFKRIVLIEGDNVPHSAEKGGLKSDINIQVAKSK